MSWKGTKENVSSLPQSGNQVGDLWHVNEDGNEYAWDGSKWEALGGIHSSGSDPFVIPITQSGSTYTTTASAADILANIDNCVITFEGLVVAPTGYSRVDSTAFIIVELTTNSGEYISNITFNISAANGAVFIEQHKVDVQPELPSGGSTGDFLRKTASGVAWETILAAESNSF